MYSDCYECSVLCILLSLCCSMYCLFKCVLYYCHRVSTQMQLTNTYIMYQIISYILYHICINIVYIILYYISFVNIFVQDVYSYISETHPLRGIEFYSKFVVASYGTCNTIFHEEVLLH